MNSKYYRVHLANVPEPIMVSSDFFREYFGRLYFLSGQHVKVSLPVNIIDHVTVFDDDRWQNIWR